MGVALAPENNKLFPVVVVDRSIESNGFPTFVLLVIKLLFDATLRGGVLKIFCVEFLESVSEDEEESMVPYIFDLFVVVSGCARVVGKLQFLSNNKNNFFLKKKNIKLKLTLLGIFYCSVCES